jgi:hyperosmotically inducible protein
MKTRGLGTLFTVFVAIPLLGIGAANAKPSSVNAPDTSSPIVAQVRHQLATLPWYGVFDNLEYRVDGSEVILSGQLISEHATTKSQAEKSVSRIPGVTKVVNNIEVLPPSPMDNQIRRAEYRAIFSRPTLGRYSTGAIPQVHIIVNGGHVTLDGVVMNQMDKTIAGISANSVPGVFSVTNNLQVG